MWPSVLTVLERLRPFFSGLIAVTAWVGVLTTAFFLILKKTDMLRVPEDEEHVGMDISKHGGLAYNNRPSDLAQKINNSRVSPADIEESA